MSDKHQPENAGAKPPERGMPVAGRQPDPAAQPVRAGDEPTVVTTPPVPDPATQPVGAGDEATRRLSVPAGPAVDDEPTVERPERPELDAETQRLRPPAVVPGKEKAPVTRPVPAEETAPAKETPRAGETPPVGERPRVAEIAQAEGAPRAEEAARVDEAARVLEWAPSEDDGRAAEKEPSGAGPAGAEERREEAPSPDPVISGNDAAPESGGAAPGVPISETARTGTEDAGPRPAQPPWRRLSSAGALIWVLLALFGFTLVVQLRSNNADDGLASARQEDLVRILSDLEARDTRLQAEITALETSQRQLTSGVAGREAALAEADKRAAELGLLAGTRPGRGPGLEITMRGVKASAVLNAVQELRGAGGEVMQLNGAGGGAVRIVASTYFVDAEGGGIVADGTRLGGPFTLWVIGPPQTMQTALQIPGGVVASVNGDGGSVTMEQRPSVDVTAVREASSLQYARPVS